jgi:serine palmitoyltransferase
MLEPFSAEFAPYLEYLSQTSSFIIKLIKLIPGSDILIRYVRSSHQNDPFRTLLELSLVFFIIRTWRQSRTRGDVGSGKSFVKLTEKVRGVSLCTRHDHLISSFLAAYTCAYFSGSL